VGEVGQVGECAVGGGVVETYLFIHVKAKF
jgi:hypothetical protein